MKESHQHIHPLKISDSADISHRSRNNSHSELNLPTLYQNDSRIKSKPYNFDIAFQNSISEQNNKLHNRQVILRHGKFPLSCDFRQNEMIGKEYQQGLLMKAPEIFKDLKLKTGVLHAKLKDKLALKKFIQENLNCPKDQPGKITGTQQIYGNLSERGKEFLSGTLDALSTNRKYNQYHMKKLQCKEKLFPCPSGISLIAHNSIFQINQHISFPILIKDNTLLSDMFQINMRCFKLKDTK